MASKRTDPAVDCWGDPSLRMSFKQDVKHWVHLVATNRVESVALRRCDGDGLDRAVRQIERHRVTSVMGYPTGSWLLADHPASAAHSSTRHMRSSRIRNALRRAEASHRIRFGFAPGSDYVASEGAIAHECPASADSMSTWKRRCSLDRPDPGYPDVGGTTAVTVPAHLRFSPYPLSDRRRRPLGCSSLPVRQGLVTLDGLVGRYADGIRLPDGRFFTAANINMRIAHLPLVAGFRQYQIAQVGPAAIELRVPTDDAAGTSEAIEQFVTALHDIFGSAEYRTGSPDRAAAGEERQVWSVVGWSGGTD